MDVVSHPPITREITSSLVQSRTRLFNSPSFTGFTTQPITSLPSSIVQTTWPNGDRLISSRTALICAFSLLGTSLLLSPHSGLRRIHSRSKISIIAWRKPYWYALRFSNGNCKRQTTINFICNANIYCLKFISATEGVEHPSRSRGQ